MKQDLQVNYQPLIDLNQVSKRYEGAAGEFMALKAISLQVKPGEFVAIVGKSGSGKSTLINMMTGIDRPTSGEVRVTSATLGGLSEDDLAVWRGRNVGVVFQFFQLLPTLSVIENIMLPMDLCGELARARTTNAGIEFAGACRHCRASRQVAQHTFGRAAAAGGHCACPGQQPAADCG